MKTRRDKMEIIKDLLCNAVEGISYKWCRVESHNKKNIPDCKYLSELLTFEDGKMTVSDCSGEEACATKEVSHKDVFRAWDKFKNDYNRHYQDAINGHDDAITADVFFQLVVLDDVIFG